MSTATSKQEHTYSVLRGRIVDGTYGPGHRLVIDAIAREFDVSQMPVREAIRRLEAEGWVTYQRNYGAHVAPINTVEWTEAMGSLAVLEGYATAIAAPHLNAQGFSRLRAINEEMAQAIDALDVLRVSERNQAFHKLIYDHCPNTHMRRQMEAIQERLTTLTRTVFTFIPTRGRVSLEEHAELVDLIEKGGDPLEVELLARTHKLHTVAAYEERLNNSGDG